MDDIRDGSLIVNIININEELFEFYLMKTYVDLIKKRSLLI